ncbi:VWA domain-containing protein [uncultured Polaribacter sp.]|uniref:VWA domain-containing protein n=1 Tax=uncultured Polaribacter sp. TaxID=174711 RepID=UPI002601D1E1|nr:VWA domain-containing protein [uncultured Polaribacter sp.]
MQSLTLLYIVIALLISLFVAYFQYFYKAKNTAKVTISLFFLKALSLFLLLLLLINPIIKTTTYQNTKPTLSVLVDHSKSIEFFNEAVSVKDIVNQLKTNNSLNDKFALENFGFGDNLQVTDSVFFNANETNIYKAINGLDNLNKRKNAPIILITDGNQTIGNDYEFISSNKKIYPIVVGDTTIYKDLKITQVNVNKYSYIKNKFPVEVILNYQGKESITTKFSIFNGAKIVFTKNITFSKEVNSKIITTNLTSTKEGLNYYTASLQKIENEKNTQNNTKNFSVEVIDEQTKILIVTAVLHPDIGAIKKAIESNKQRAVDVFLISEFKNQINDYQLVTVYNPNNKFNNLLNEIKQNNSNFILVTGTNTDWNFLNKQQLGFFKKHINQTENYGANYNSSFLTFLQKDIGFDQFAPLEDKFGEVIFSKDHQNLLTQKINGIQTEQPLLSVLNVNNQKISVVFGEGIWKWRASSFLNTNSFQEFDQFIGNLVQFTASNKKRSRLEVNTDNLYPANSNINISAFYTDKNYKFDARASIEITITNTATKEVKKLPLSLINNSYQVSVDNLISGDYIFSLEVLGQNIKKYGKFKISDYQIEEQFTSANKNKLQKLASKTGGKLYYKNQIESLIQHLIEDKTYFTTQKSIEKEQNLIDWKWILFLVVVLFTAEWFIRKYFGKI